ncbi:hypothetical protein CAPTEDRAFT_225486 [Capitella teleta]|uniref:Sulfotransferase domain-containing protein n=1 Tax=Capitella teleta TaxID=283909 RepID=R7UBD8_CAPTE|nr:hypothetical protein CAPTEDRAFT_225486 [Capitella teleta]|eukprot:ELU03685.1 hypothetical protein CAPTEDRAFT_225486 [Capitella teleta]
MSTNILSLFGIIFLVVISTVDSARVLLLCEEVKGHQEQFTILAEELVNEGHEVFWLLNENSPFSETFHGLHKHPVFFSGEQLKFDDLEFYDFATQTALKNPGEVSRIHEMAAQRLPVLARTVLMDNEEVMRELEEAGIDLAIVSGFVISKYLYLIPHRLRVPLVTLADSLEPWHVRIPWLPSFVPLSILPMTDRLSFVERVQNMFLYIFFHVNSFAPPLPNEILETYSQYGPISSANEIIRKTKLWITSTDPVIDYPKPRMPNMIEAGGLASGPGRPLTEPWSSIVEDANEHGIILVSLGTIHLPKNISTKLLTAFASLPQTVIWLFDNAESIPLPDNIITSDQLPLKDILPHPNVEVFITHCSNDDQFDAVYHGVPMVGMPVHGDQFYNARRISHKDFGVVVDITKFEPHELNSAIQEVINNPSYRENISKASLIFHDRPETPVERAVSAIQQLIQFGGDHMQTYATEMPLYQFLMLDVLAFCGLILLLILVVMALVVSCCWSLMCRKTPFETRPLGSSMDFCLPGEYVYRGITYCFANKVDIDMMKDWHTRPSDVLIATPPKSGTHWMGEIIRQMRKFHPEAKGSEVSMFIPYLEIDLPQVPRAIERSDSIPAPRIIKTHLPYEFMKQKVEQEGLKQKSDQVPRRFPPVL